MIPLDNPILRDYLAAARTRPADGEMARVYLFDRLADVGGFGFVGDVGGPTLADACWWYSRGEDEDEPALRMALAEMTEAIAIKWKLGNDPRPQIIRVMGEEYEKYRHAHVTEEDVFSYTIHHLRRRVLALYPEVKFGLQFRVSKEEALMARDPQVIQQLVDRYFKAHGFRTDLPIQKSLHPENWGEGGIPVGSCWQYDQILTAPDLIPPEPANVSWNNDPLPLRENFTRTIREAVDRA